jgi:hypothetical protein
MGFMNLSSLTMAFDNKSADKDNWRFEAMAKVSVNGPVLSFVPSQALCSRIERLVAEEAKQVLEEMNS